MAKSKRRRSALLEQIRKVVPPDEYQKIVDQGKSDKWMERRLAKTAAKAS